MFVMQIRPLSASMRYSHREQDEHETRDDRCRPQTLPNRRDASADRSAMQGGLSELRVREYTSCFENGAQTILMRSFAEESLSGVCADDLPVDLIVQGRCDLIVLSPKGELTLIEVKGFRGSAHSLPSEGDAAHWTQAYLYAHLLLESGFRDGLMIDASDVTIELHYTSFDVDESFVLTRRTSTNCPFISIRRCDILRWQCRSLSIKCFETRSIKMPDFRTKTARRPETDDAQ